MMRKQEVRMKNLAFRKAYPLREIIDLISQEVAKNGFTNEPFYIYTKADDTVAKADLVCYLELGPSITEDDEEIYPDVVLQESLELFYSGEQFEDVLMNVLHQKNTTATMDDCIVALNYYLRNDTFFDF